jgi:hypothetical protein
MAKQKKYNNNSKKNKQTRKRGGCGCGISGGKTRLKKQMKGGSTNLTSLPIRYYHQLNSEEHNPNNPNVIGHSTKQFLGGKSKKNKNKKRNNKSRKHKRVIKGGGMLNSILNGTQVNVATGFGTTMGSNMAYNMQNISSNQVDNVTKQPVGDLNNEHSHPLV